MEAHLLLVVRVVLVGTFAKIVQTTDQVTANKTRVLFF